MSPQMKALTLVEHALGTIPEEYARKHLPLDRITPEQLTEIECLATKGWKSHQAEAYAAEVLAALEQPVGGTS